MVLFFEKKGECTFWGILSCFYMFLQNGILGIFVKIKN